MIQNSYDVIFIKSYYLRRKLSKEIPKTLKKNQNWPLFQKSTIRSFVILMLSPRVHADYAITRLAGGRVYR